MEDTDASLASTGQDFLVPDVVVRCVECLGNSIGWRENVQLACEGGDCQGGEPNVVIPAQPPLTSPPKRRQCWFSVKRCIRGFNNLCSTFDSLVRTQTRSRPEHICYSILYQLSKPSPSHTTHNRHHDGHYFPRHQGRHPQA